MINKNAIQTNGYPDSGYLSVCMAFYDRLYSDGIYFVSSLILPVFTFGSIKFVYA